MTRINQRAVQLPIREFSQSLPMLLLRGREAVMRQFRPQLREFGLTEQQWRILRALSASGECDVADLAHAAFILGPSLSRILKDLVERKLVIRRVVKADLRRSMVSLSKKGERLIEQVAPSSEAIYAQITAAFGESQLAILQDLLRALDRDLAALPRSSHITRSA